MRVYLNDKVVKQALSNESEIIREYVIRIIGAIFKIDLEELRKNIKLITPEVDSNYNTVKSICDVVYTDDDNYFNIEVNAYGDKLLSIKNNIYLYNLILRQVINKDDYKYIKPVIQININDFDKFKMDKFIYTSKMCETTYNIVRDEYLIIIDISLPVLEKMDYNIIKEMNDFNLEKFLYLFVCNNQTKLDEIYGDESFMDKVKERLMTYKQAIDSNLWYDEEEFDKLRMETLKEESIKEGFEQGIDKNRNDMIISMYSNKISLDDIAKISKLSLEEVKNIISKK